MKKILLCLFAPMAWVSQAQVSCETAIEVGVAQQISSYQNVANQPLQNCATTHVHTPKIVWYKFTAPESKIYRIHSNVPGYPILDTRVHVYTGTCDALSCVGGDDDSGDGNSSSFILMASAGTTYYIAWDSQYSSADFRWAIDEFASSDNAISWINMPGYNPYIYMMGLIDADGDYIDDMVGVAPEGIVIRKLNENNEYESRIIPFATELGYMPNWSMTGGDLNNDGINDYVIGNGSRAVIVQVFENNTATYHFENQYVFSQRSNITDMNNDGFNDVFVCHDVAPNIQYRNNGDGTFTYNQGGMGIHPNGGNYGSIFVDIDNDGDQDLFIAKCKAGNSSASRDELFRNDGNYVFTNITEETGMDFESQSWSSAWADFNNDGYLDVLVGVSTHGTGGHKLMFNNGDGTFTDVTAGSGWDTNTGTSYEYLAHDYDNDGWVDILYGGSGYMRNNGDGTFTMTAASGVVVGGIGDVNNDGFLDIYNGNTVRLAVPNNNNWFKVTLQGVQSNRNGIGARLEIHGAWGVQIREIRSGEGFRYMHSLNANFGLGQNDVIDQLVIRWPSGTVDVINNPTINSVTHVVEGQTLSTSNWETTRIQVSPNPASEVLQVNGAVFTSAKIYDTLGRVVSEQTIIDNTLYVSNLSKGVYILVATAENGLAKTVRFIKE